MHRFRVQLLAPPDFRLAANLWVEWRDLGDDASLRLLHDYPDLPVAKGWRVVKDGEVREVTDADGREVRLSAIRPAAAPEAKQAAPKAGGK